MHYAGADLNFFQFNSVDVILFLVAAVYVFFKFLAFVVNKICGGSGKQKKKEKKEKKKRN